MLDKNKIVIYTDGGARGNPGPAGIGIVIELPNGEKKKYKGYIGKATNNIAEYTAVVTALTKIKTLIDSRIANIEIRADSELLVRQMKKEYKVKNQGLRPLYEKAENLSEQCGKVVFVHIPREKNSEADALVNEAIDSAIE